MRKAVVIVLSILALLAATAAAYTWVNAFVNSIYGYRSPLKGAPPLTEYTTRPLTSQVVLVLADGLRYDTSLQMPYLNSLRKLGGHARMLSSPPSNTQTGWTALISGASPELNDTPLFDRDYAWIRPIAVDHLFAALQRAGATAGIAGFHWWEKLVPSDDLYTKYYVSTEGDAADREIIDRATMFLNEFRPNFLLVHLRQVEMAGQQYGGASTQYEQAAMRCDEHIRRLAASMNLKRSVLIVTSSHGHLDEGGHGGEETITLSTPLVIVGENVRPGDYDVLSQTDFAPTVAALLGAPIPSAAQGRMRVDVLRTNSVDQAEKLVALASQRVRIGNVFLGSVGRGGLSETAEGDMAVALSSLQVKNYDSAYELASLSIQQTDREMALARRSRLWRERAQRGLPIAAAVLAPLWIIWHERSKRMAWSLLAALLSAALYHAQFLLQGNTYSFSRVPTGGLAATFRPSLEYAAVALGAGALIITLRTWREQERSVFAVVMRTYGYASLQLYFVGLLVGACTWWNGPLLRWYLPSLTLAYVHFAALMQAMLIAGMALVLPAVVVILQRALLVITDLRSRNAMRVGGAYAGRDHR
jgi:hypothetical protein